MDLVLISFPKHELQEMIRSIVSDVVGITASSLINGKEKHLSAEEAAEFTQLPKSTLYSYTSKRLIPHYKRGKRLVFKQSDLETWLTENKMPTVSEIAQDAFQSISKRGGKK